VITLHGQGVHTNHITAEKGSLMR